MIGIKASIRRNVTHTPNGTLSTLSQQNPPAWQNQTPTSLRFKSSLGTRNLTEDKETQSEIQLEPVPRLYNALFKPVRHQRIQAQASIDAGMERYHGEGLSTGRSWLETHTRAGLDVVLRNREDGQRLLAESWEQTRPTETSMGFNAIIARLHCLGLEPSSRHIVYGMKTAVYPSAMKQYLTMLDKLIDHDPLSVEEYVRTFKLVAKGLLRERQRISQAPTPEISEWDLHRRKEQWFNVFTGSRKDKSDAPTTPRDFSLYDLGPGISRNYWDIYMQLLRVFVGESAVYEEYLWWSNIEQAQRPARIPSRQNANQEIAFPNQLLNLTIKEIAKINIAFAYEVVQKHAENLQDIDMSTWRALFADPNLFHRRISRMFPRMKETVRNGIENKVLRLEEQMPNRTAPMQLERGLLETERYLGIQWSGGEDGYHVPSQIEGFLKIAER